MAESFLFGVFPYIAVVLAMVGLVWRYVTNQFSYSSVSSQFLENRQLFWGSVLWHYGIVAILLGHFIAILLPSGVKAFNAVPLRLYILEGTGLALSMLLLVGLLLLIVRRGASTKVRKTTSAMDVVLLAVLLAQVVTGILTAVIYRWGSAWFVQTATPYLWSLVTLSPEAEYMTSLPVLTRVHIINVFVLIGLFPFTRLVHMLSIPLAYLWRPYQIVMWHRRQVRQ